MSDKMILVVTLMRNNRPCLLVRVRKGDEKVVRF